ncbi:MAG TPA: serine hydrolase, partial [Acidimicrobiales bacterium]|nr:serine hydrolase [Acidimicrobiales bacterium]
YLRALVWLLIASPVLLRAVRARPWIVFGLAIASVFALDVVDRHPAWWPDAAPRLPWQIGDFALYGVFLMAGFAHRSGWFVRVRVVAWLAIALLAAGAATAWRLTQPVPLGVVNNSHPLHLFVGAGWLAFGLAVQPVLSAAARSRALGGAIRLVGRRSLTIYLWHTVAIIVALNLLDRHGTYPRGVHSTSLVLLTLVGTLTAVGIFGWIEDFSARRAGPRPTPLPTMASSRPAFAFASLIGITAALATLAPVPGRVELTTATAAARRPTVPSQQPPRPRFSESAPAATGIAVPADLSPASLASELDRLLSDWAATRSIRGAVVGVASGDEVVWTGASGRWTDTRTLRTTDDRFELASVTKLFTAALVMRAADAGLIDIDAPLPRLDALPDFPYDADITVADLLQHRTGLVNYRDTPEYAEDPEPFGDAATAVAIALQESPIVGPGQPHNYSSTNYLVLGLLLEQVTGQSYDDLLRRQLFAPLRLTDTIHLPPTGGEPRQATAGIETDVDDFVRAGIGILRNHVGITVPSAARMADIDPISGAGNGTFGYCPCTYDANGEPRFFAYGHTGGTTLVAYSPAVDMTVAVDLTDSLWENGRYDAVVELMSSIGALIAAMPH